MRFVKEYPRILRTILFLVAVAPSLAWGAVAWDETVNGDLSSNPNAPTTVSLAVGSNLVSGTSIAITDTYDYMTFTIAPGQSLTSLLLMDFVDVDSGFPGNTAFHAIIAGSTSFVPDFDNIGNFMGGNHLDALPTGTDVLPDLAAAIFGGTGFTIPLGPGTYTYHVQQVDTLLTGYSLDFVIAGDAPETADFDDDGDVDGEDFLLWQRGDSPRPVSQADLILWQDQFGEVGGLATIAVPEPGIASLLLITAATGLSVGRRRIG